MKYVLLSVSLVTSMFIATSCGGGGGSTETTTTTKETLFPSNASVAEPSIENAKEIKAVLLKDVSSLYANSESTQNSTTNTNTLVEANKVNEKIAKRLLKESYSLNEAVTETSNCIDGGTITLNGTGTQTETTIVLDAIATYNKCSEYGMIIDGKAHLSLSSSYENDVYTSRLYTEYLSDTTITNSTLSMKVLQGSNVLIEQENLAQRTTLNSVELHIYTNKKYASKDLILYAYESAYEYQSFQASGTIYINNLENYVTLDPDYDSSKTPFLIQDNRLITGESRYLMANGAKAKLVIENGAFKVYVDSNGDGVYELSE